MDIGLIIPQFWFLSAKQNKSKWTLRTQYAAQSPLLPLFIANIIRIYKWGELERTVDEEPFFVSREEVSDIFGRHFC